MLLPWSGQLTNAKRAYFAARFQAYFSAYFAACFVQFVRSICFQHVCSTHRALPTALQANTDLDYAAYGHDDDVVALTLLLSLLLQLELYGTEGSAFFNYCWGLLWNGGIEPQSSSQGLSLLGLSM